MKNLKEGDIIFLTKRDWEWYKFWDLRGILSNLISYFSKSEIVHSAIIYRKVGCTECLRVAEMEKNGKITWKLEDYINKYKKRAIVAYNPIIIIGNGLEDYNNQMHSSVIKYDYFNLFVVQLIKSLFKQSIGKETKHKNICSEFVARSYNLLVGKKYFKNSEWINPSELYEYINWKKEKLK